MGGQGAAAATVLLQYLGQVDEAVLTLARAREWREALRVAALQGREDLVPTVVAPAGAEAASSLLAEAREAVAKVCKYQARLREVRGKREALDAALRAAGEEEGEGETEGGAAGLSRQELEDAASDSSASVVSGLSLYTTHTHAATGATPSAVSQAPSTQGGRKAAKAASKRASKAQRGRVRQGSPEEEASLVSHLLGLAPSVVQLQEAGGLAELLITLGHESDARTLQAAVTAWQAAHKAALEELKTHPLDMQLVPLPLRDSLTQLQQQAAAAAATTVAWKWDMLRQA
ncbi:hypothetical protein V8C86DRAFT_3142693 [Haematococcus lacustris]